MATRATGRILAVLATAVAAGHEKAARSDPGQFLAFGQTKVTPGTQVESPLFVAFQLSPIVDAEELPRRHANRLTVKILASFPFRLGKKVSSFQTYQSS